MKDGPRRSREQSADISLVVTKRTEGTNVRGRRLMMYGEPVPTSSSKPTLSQATLQTHIYSVTCWFRAKRAECYGQICMAKRFSQKCQFSRERFGKNALRGVPGSEKYG
jgi:hypothetical protein